MEKDLERLSIENEDADVLVAPYYIITYIDDWNKTHIAMIKDTWYLQFLQERFNVKDCKYIAE